MSDPQVGPQVTLAALGAALVELRAKVDTHLLAVDHTIRTLVVRNQRRTRRALIGAYALSIGALALVALVGWLGFREAKTMDTLEAQQVQIAIQDAETQSIRRGVLCPFVAEALAYVPVDLTAAQNAEYQRRLGIFRHAYVTLRCDQPG